MRLHTNLIVQESRKLNGSDFFFVNFPKLFGKTEAWLTGWCVGLYNNILPPSSANQWQMKRRMMVDQPITKQINVATCLTEALQHGWSFVLFVLWLGTCRHCHITRKQLLGRLNTGIGFWPDGTNRVLESVCDDYDFGGGKASHLNGIIAIMPKAQTVILGALLDTQNCLSLPGPHSRSRPHKAGETQVPKGNLTSIDQLCFLDWFVAPEYTFQEKAKCAPCPYSSFCTLLKYWVTLTRLHQWAILPSTILQNCLVTSIVTGIYLFFAFSTRLRLLWHYVWPEA